MSPARRQAAARLLERLAAVKAEALALYEVQHRSFAALPMALQFSDRGVEAQAAAEALDRAVCALDDAEDHLAEAAEA